MDDDLALEAGWTVETLRIYMLALRAGDERFNDERDRRYAEVATEKEKALRIKETADLAALQLAREIQTYKDEKANELREQISSERGLYATQGDLRAAMDSINATLRPVLEFVSRAQGSASTVMEARQQTNWTVGAGIGFAGIVLALTQIALHFMR